MIRALLIRWLKSLELKVWKVHAERCGASRYSISRIRVVCKITSHKLVEEAFSNIEGFDAALLDNLHGIIKTIIFIEKGESGIIPGKRTVLISEKDQSHTSTATHLAGWILYYSELLRGVENVGLASWIRGEGHISAEQKAKQLRQSFLFGK